jgi:hypothetical protein
MKNLSKIFVLTLAVMTSTVSVAGERGILVLSDGEKIVVDQLRFKAEPFQRDWTRDCAIVDCRK